MSQRDDATQENEESSSLLLRSDLPEPRPLMKTSCCHFLLPRYKGHELREELSLLPTRLQHVELHRGDRPADR